MSSSQPDIILVQMPSTIDNIERAGSSRENQPKINAKGSRTFEDGEPPRNQRFELVPDWICEILSASSMETRERRIKMPIYAYYGVGFAWLIDPLKKMLALPPCRSKKLQPDFPGVC